MWLTMRSIRSAGLEEQARVGAARASASIRLAQQLAGKEVAHQAVGRMHGQQHAVKHCKAHGAGVDRAHGLLRRNQRAVLVVHEELGAANAAARRRKTSRSYQEV